MEGGSESSKDFGLSKKVETNSQKEEAPMDEKAKIIELEKIKGKTEDEEKKEDLNKIEVGVVIEETKKGDVKEIDKMKNGEGKKDDVKEINEMKNDEDNEEEVKVINEMRNDERDINKEKEETTPSGFDPDNPNIHPNKSDVNKSKEEKEKVEVIKEIKNEEVKKEDVTRNDPIDETKKEDDHTTSEGEAIRTEDEKKLEKEKGDESNEKDEKNLREVKGDESKEKDEKNLKEEKGDESEEKDEKNISDIDVKGKAVTIDQNPKFVEETNKHVEVVEGEASVSSSSSCNVVVSRLSFKEESNLFSDLKENEKKALVELRSKVEEAINGNQFFKAPENGDQKEMEKPNEEAQGNKEMPEINGEEKKEQENDKDKNLIMEAEDIKLWGVPLSQSNGGSATDAVLLKFLRARDFKIIEAFEMLRNTLQWRKENKMDSILDEDLGNDFRDTSYISGNDRQGHPVCYNVFGVFDDDEMYNKTLGTEENREKFLRWRLRLMEEGIEKIDFIGVSSMMQINDLKNTPGPSKKEVRLFMKQVVSLLQDNYPEFVVKNIFINVPFWYYAFAALLSPFLTQRTKSKFVYARPSKVTETLLKYIDVEEIPVCYGGLKCDNDSDFIADDHAEEILVKQSSTETIEIPAPEVGSVIIWDLVVLGWEVSYREEFIPDDEKSYTIVVQKEKKIGTQEGSIRNSFKNNEAGKIVLIIGNTAFKTKKRAFYRYKTKNI